jgi:hypothetical protein
MREGLDGGTIAGIALCVVGLGTLAYAAFQTFSAKPAAAATPVGVTGLGMAPRLPPPSPRYPIFQAVPSAPGVQTAGGSYGPGAGSGGYQGGGAYGAGSPSGISQGGSGAGGGSPSSGGVPYAGGPSASPPANGTIWGGGPSAPPLSIPAPPPAYTPSQTGTISPPSSSAERVLCTPPCAPADAPQAEPLSNDCLPCSVQTYSATMVDSYKAAMTDITGVAGTPASVGVEGTPAVGVDGPPPVFKTKPGRFMAD